MEESERDDYNLVPWISPRVRLNPRPRLLQQILLLLVARDILLPLVNLEVALFARDEGKEGDERENWDDSGY